MVSHILRKHLREFGSTRWTLTLRGKVDQWLEDDGPYHNQENQDHLSSLLPMEEEELLEHYPNYFAQLQTYLAL